ncbi:toxin co-regulated pilus biosynthesis Q family protein [Roseiterribacter gracilis]|uniref:Toxin co-regulated pilus biosynthesis protein Q C-terminal domain-containing protein n=1 Tax=Roseiterribacter gracilis TaxID=2812848 RepID=A0A8S8XAE3_9PROT|nr:hypothetical protein TMPK1_26800 [Rhodospirillales bacterium TMPK1]
MKGSGRAGGRLVVLATLLLSLAGCARAPIDTEPTMQVTDAERTGRGGRADDADARFPERHVAAFYPAYPAAETLVATPEPASLRAALPRFDMVPGTTLRETLERWAAASGWTVRWASDRAYPIKGRATFDGDFVQAAGDLIRSFRALNPPPIARFYTRNHELRVVTPGDEMGE